MPLILKMRPSIPYSALWLTRGDWEKGSPLDLVAMLNAAGPHLCEAHGGLLALVDGYEWTDRVNEPERGLLHTIGHHTTAIASRRFGQVVAADYLGVNPATVSRHNNGHTSRRALRITR